MHKSNCLVSIIVPIYNVSNYLKDCLASIKNQSYKNFEAILIDDGSTDDSYQIAKEFCDYDSRFRLFKKKNGGLSSARNKGLNFAAGDYITFIDSDDVVSCDYLSILLHYAKKFDADICFSNFKYFDRYIQTFYKFDGKQYSFLSKNDFFDVKENTVKVIVCAKLFKKAIFEKLKFKNKKLHEDEFFYTSLFKLDLKNIVYISTPLYFYRNNPNSISHKRTDKNYIHLSQAFLKRLKVFKKGRYSNQNTINSCLSFLHRTLYEREWKKYYFLRTQLMRKYFFWDFYYNYNKRKIMIFLFRFLFPRIYNFLQQKHIFNKVNEFFSCFNKFIYFYFLKYIIKPKVVYLGSISHGNLGDHAICYSSLELMKKNKIKCFDLNQKEFTEKYRKWIKKKKIIIALRGGGNIGNVWLHEEKFHRDVIKEFPNNKIIFFPESIFFSNDKSGKKEASISSNIYLRHKNLTIFLRDIESYKRAKQLFKKNTILLVPDIVFSLKTKNTINKNVTTPKTAVFIFRNDIEKNKKSNNFGLLIKKLLLKKGYSIETSDTVLPYNIKRCQIQKTLFNYLNEISKYELIVTDRLHGMIFAYILGKTFLALDNNNGKVKSSYMWINKIDNSFFVKDKKDINTIIEQISSKRNFVARHQMNFNNYYQLIIDSLTYEKKR